MKAFKEFLGERIDFGTETIELLSHGMLPISPRMMDYLGYSYGEIVAYHMTNHHDYPKSGKLPKKSQLSVFTKFDPELLKLPSNPDIVVKVKGRLLIEGRGDIYTFLDVNGRRWIKLNTTVHNTGAGKKLEFFVRGIVSSVSKEYGEGTFGFYREYLKKLQSFMDKQGYKLLNKHLQEVTMKYNEIVMDRIQTLGYWSIDGIDKGMDFPFFGKFDKKVIK